MRSCSNGNLRTTFINCNKVLNMKTTDILNEAISLPVEERVILVDSLLKTLNSPSPNIDKLWAEIAQRRLLELRSGEVKAVPGDEVFKRIWERFSA